jgi:hypothetical protein
MKHHGTSIKHPKQRGEWAELCFMVRAAEYGLHVSKPWGDSTSYDFTVEHAGRLARIRVKSTMCTRFGGYCCQVRGAQRRAYAENAFDFVAIYIIPEDVWYIVPEARTRGHSNLFLRPKNRSKFGRYKEAWHLLRGKPVAGRIIEHIEACAEIPLQMETAMAF